MKKVLLCTYILFLIVFLSGCKMIFHHFKFSVDEIQDLKKEEYLTNEKADFLRVEDVAIYPLMGNKGDEGYFLSICAISKNNFSEIKIKSFSISETESKQVILFEDDLNKKIEFDGNYYSEYGLYDASIEVGTILKDDYEINKSEATYFNLKTCVEITKKGIIKTEIIEYTIKVTPYVTLDCPFLYVT